VKIEDLRNLGPDEIESLYGGRKVEFPREVISDVKRIIDDVAERGDEALIEYTGKFDDFELTPGSIRVSDEEIAESMAGCDEKSVEAIEIAIDRVEKFHKKAVPGDWAFIDEYGNLLGQRCTPLDRIGVYIPGGKASYPSTLVMTAVIAMVAGVKEIAVISPPSSFTAPSLISAVIKRIGAIADVYRVGGVQGIAALAFGTRSVRKVDKIVGPGNIYVTVAKKELYGYVDIDMIAGPSEVLVISDGSVEPELTASDLIAQAEHDELARALCVTTSMENAREISEWVERLKSGSKRGKIIESSLEKNGRIYVVDDMKKAVALANAVSPEHLEIQASGAKSIAAGIKNAGAIFLGKYSAEAFGDYIAGPSHVLPTGGTARFFSPLTTMSFMKFSSIIEMSKEGARELGSHARRIAEEEGLEGHARSIMMRREEPL